MHRRSLLTLLCALSLAGCRTTEVHSSSVLAARPAQPAAPAPPWTRDFETEAVLVAREVRIEGPSGLLDHVAMMQDPIDWTVNVRTAPEGLVQEARVRPESANIDAAGRPLLRVHLDNLTVAVSHLAVVLERPTHDADVVVRASGEVLYHDVTGSEHRGEDLTLVGRRPGR